jgi:hypothetical protein
MTIREFVIHALSWSPYDSGATATQIWHFAKATHRDIKLSSLSGELCRMVKRGELTVYRNFGPRGGNGYRLTPKPDPYNHAAHMDYDDPYYPMCGGNAVGSVGNPDWKPDWSKR